MGARRSACLHLFLMQTALLIQQARTLPDHANQASTSASSTHLAHQLAGQIKLLADKDVAESLNWADQASRVGPVRSQGWCGSCWAIATAGLLEGQQKPDNQSEPVTQLSVQQLIDCDRIGRNWGCLGGHVDAAVEHIVKYHGLESETDYPYASDRGKDDFKCAHNPTRSIGFTKQFKKASVLEHIDELQLKQVLASYGPIAVSIYSSMTSMFKYQSGVFYDEKCIGRQPDHYVLLVGYGTDDTQGDYWVLKNSWGPDWGQAGYLWLARNRDGHCGILASPTIVL